MVAREATFDLNHQALHKGLRSSIKERGRAEESGDRKRILLSNVEQFALLFNFDLSCLLRDMRARPNTWHTKLHARTLVLAMFECVADFMSLLGRDFRSVVKTIDSDGSLLLETNRLHTELRSFVDRYPRFEEIRNIATAHRDHDAAVQIHLLETLDVDEVESAGYSMVQWLTRLHDLTGRMTRMLKASKQAE